MNLLVLDKEEEKIIREALEPFLLRSDPSGHRAWGILAQLDVDPQITLDKANFLLGKEGNRG